LAWPNFSQRAIFHHFDSIAGAQQSLSTEIGLTNHARRAWVQSIVDQKKDILAVQTIRNWMMVFDFSCIHCCPYQPGLCASAFRSEIASSVTKP